jgi:tRNA G18 (ribose-2'-O)-methylase SpoU
MRKLKNEDLNRISPGEFKNAAKIPVVVILDNVRSMNNVGSVFRTCDAFRIEEIHLCGITAQPPNKEIHKTALGATESVNWKYYRNTLDSVKELKNKGFLIISVEQVENSRDLNSFVVCTDYKYAIIFGNEIRGVQQEVVDNSDVCIEINQYGTKHSLNISVCAGIIIWEFYRKFRDIFNIE